MSYADIQQPMPKSNKRKVLTIVLSLIGAFFLLSGGCIALIIKAGTAGYGEAKVGAEHFLMALEKHDNSDARAQMTENGQTTTTLAGIEDTIAVAEKRRGNMVRHEGPVNWRENTYNGVTTVQLVYKEIFEHGDTTINLTMLGDSGNWKVQNFEINF